MRSNGSEELRERECPAEETSGRPFVRTMRFLREAGEGKLLSPSKRRKLVLQVCMNLAVSERRACRVLGQPRATQRHIPQIRSEEERLTREIVKLRAFYGRYGYRRITALLRQEGWKVNHKRVERIWRREGLKVPKKQPKRGRLWLNDGSCVRLKAQSQRSCVELVRS